MADWMTIRVVLLGSAGEEFERPPGRVLLASTDHTFLDLAEAIDAGFARWDLSHLHEFDVEGRRLVLGGDPDDAEAEDSEQVTLGEVGLRIGSRFTYVFDLGEGWLHEATVTADGVDPFEAYGDEPELPAAMFGWGLIPDQYRRMTEDDEADEDLEDELDDLDEIGELDAEPAWAPDDAQSSSWDVVADALGGAAPQRPDSELAAAAARLRDADCADDWACDALWTIARLDPDTAPEDDERLWLELAAAIVSASEEGEGLTPETEAALTLMEPADWAGAVIMLARGGVGQSAQPADLVELIAQCPEVEAGDLDEDDEDALRSALEAVTALWQRLGALDRSLALTRLGLWGLPQALHVAWARA